MIRVEIVKGKTTMELENKINNILNDYQRYPDISIIDIKYAFYNDTCSAMLFYRISEEICDELESG